MSDTKHELEKIKAEAEVELQRLEAGSSAKDVAGKAIGKHGLFYITLIVVIGVISSLFLEADKIAAVMGLLGASLTALISMLNGIAGATPKQEKPEFEVIKHLIDKLDRLNVEEQPMRVDVADGRVTVSKGQDLVSMKEKA
jgi:hypothetical protein